MRELLKGLAGRVSRSPGTKLKQLRELHHLQCRAEAEATTGAQVNDRQEFRGRARTQGQLKDSKRSELAEGQSCSLAQPLDRQRRGRENISNPITEAQRYQCKFISSAQRARNNQLNLALR